MTLEQGYFITQIIAGIVLVASIIFLAIQVRQNSKALERVLLEDYRQGQYSHFDEIARNRDFAALYQQIVSDYDSLDDLDKFRASFIAKKGVRVIMQSIRARLDGLVSDEEFKIIRESISQASKGLSGISTCETQLAA